MVIFWFRATFPANHPDFMATNMEKSTICPRKSEDELINSCLITAQNINQRLQLTYIPDTNLV